MNVIEESLNHIVSIVLEYATEINVDLAGAFNEVHQSNMSKFSPTNQHANESIEKRNLQGKEDYKDAYVDSAQVDGETIWIIKRKEDGKILKSLNFFEPDLSVYVK